MLSEADAYKSAATDSLKKCATMLGVALYLYYDDVPEPTDDKPVRSVPTPPPPVNRASSQKGAA